MTFPSIKHLGAYSLVNMTQKLANWTVVLTAVSPSISRVHHIMRNIVTFCMIHTRSESYVTSAWVTSISLATP